MTYYQIDGKIYYLNLDAIFELTTQTPSSERNVNTTITQYFGTDTDDNSNNGKEIVESKSTLNETMNNVRYDLIKNILTCLLTSQYGADGMPIGITRLKEMTFAQGLCFNTLIEYKILMEVENNE